MSRACACLSTVRRGMRLDLVSALLFYRCHLTHCVASFAGVSANKAFSVKVRLRSSVSTRKNQAKTFLWAKLHFFGYVATVSCTTMDFLRGKEKEDFVFLVVGWLHLCWRFFFCGCTQTPASFTLAHFKNYSALELSDELNVSVMHCSTVLYIKKSYIGGFCQLCYTLLRYHATSLLLSQVTVQFNS